jgi:asparagine synthase (glutamine-hydrolysing)
MLSWHADGLSSAEKRDLVCQLPPERLPFEEVGDSLSSLGNLDCVMALDLLWELPGDLLVKMDIATMAHGLEARSPFLDQEVVAWGNSLPESQRLSGLTTKPILRSLANRYLPAEVVNAPKRGFELPLDRWLTHDLLEMRDDMLLDPHGIVCTLFDRAAIERFLHSKPISLGHWLRVVWILLMLSAWDQHRYRPGMQHRMSA